MNDFFGYLSRMEKSMSDKLFFVDVVDISKFDFVLDFGCANGVLTKTLAKHFPNTQFLGYDKNIKMIDEANKINKQKNVSFLSDLASVENELITKKYLVIFSSVLHEVEDDIDFAISIMKMSMAVVIRDMYFDESQNQNIVAEKILSKQGDKQYQLDFEKQHGKVDNLKNLYHYFLKYTYTQNWATELLENYFSVPYNKIIDELKKQGFEICFDEKFTLPYKKEEVKYNFNFNMDLPTHRKLIFIKEKGVVLC